MEKEEEVCKLCADKLENKESISIFYCLKCSEEIRNKEGQIKFNR